LNIYNYNPETGNKLGFCTCRINDNQWMYCNVTEIAAGMHVILTCAGVEDGEEEFPALILLQEMTALVDGIANHPGVNFCYQGVR